MFHQRVQQLRVGRLQSRSPFLHQPLRVSYVEGLQTGQLLAVVHVLATRSSGKSDKLATPTRLMQESLREYTDIAPYILIRSSLHVTSYSGHISILLYSGRHFGGQKCIAVIERKAYCSSPTQVITPTRLACLGIMCL